MSVVVTTANVMIGTGTNWRGVSLHRTRQVAEDKLKIRFQVDGTTPKVLQRVLDVWKLKKIILDYTVNSHGLSPVVICNVPEHVLDEMCKKQNTNHLFVRDLEARLRNMLSQG